MAAFAGYTKWDAALLSFKFFSERASFVFAKSVGRRSAALLCLGRRPVKKKERKRKENSWQKGEKLGERGKNVRRKRKDDEEDDTGENDIKKKDRPKEKKKATKGRKKLGMENFEFEWEFPQLFPPRQVSMCVCEFENLCVGWRDSVCVCQLVSLYLLILFTEPVAWVRLTDQRIFRKRLNQEWQMEGVLGTDWPMSSRDRLTDEGSYKERERDTHTHTDGQIVIQSKKVRNDICIMHQSK